MQTLLNGAEDDLNGIQIISNLPLTVISGHESSGMRTHHKTCECGGSCVYEIM